jgi:USP6 N-terminal-like protein
VQERVMHDLLPDMYAAFQRHMVLTTAYATKLYITLFANSIPFQMQQQLGDAFLLNDQVLFVIVVLAVVWAYQGTWTAPRLLFISQADGCLALILFCAGQVTSSTASFETVL